MVMAGHASRARRAERQPGRGACRPTPRDAWLLEALGKMRFLETRQIARLAFGGSRWAANKRLRKLLDRGEAGDNVGLLLRGVEKNDLERGQVIAKPGSITPHHKFKAEIYVLTKDEGGRHTPFFNGYRPQFYFRTTDVTGVVTLP